MVIHDRTRLTDGVTFLKIIPHRFGADFSKGDNSMELFRTERLVVRKFSPDDYEDLTEILTDSEVTYFEPYETFTKEQCVKETAFFAESEDFFAVVLNDKVIGKIYFSKRDFGCYELGYTFNRQYRGKGYAAESADGMLKYAFSKLNVRRVIAEINARNERSVQLVRRLKMREEARFIEYVPRKENESIYDDMYVFATLNKEYN